MARGPGKYDDLCTLVREKAESPFAVVIIVDGNLGSGFSIQAEPEMLARLPQMLEDMAKVIRRNTDAQ